MRPKLTKDFFSLTMFPVTGRHTKLLCRVPPPHTELPPPQSSSHAMAVSFLLCMQPIFDVVGEVSKQQRH